MKACHIARYPCHYDTHKTTVIRRGTMHKTFWNIETSRGISTIVFCHLENSRQVWHREIGCNFSHPQTVEHNDMNVGG